MNGSGALVRRGLRFALRWWWRSVRPSGGALPAPEGVARPRHETGRAPRPTERWAPSQTPVGAWQDVDPDVPGRWVSGWSALVLAAWGGAVGWRVRRELGVREAD